MNILLLIIGLVLVVIGSNWMVDGASSLAKKLDVSDLVIGLTIVSFGTSAPELVINIFASSRGSADLAIGNVLGSNIFNTLAILGVAAIIFPISVQINTLSKEIPLSLLALVVLYVLANDRIIDGNSFSIISHSDGIILLSFFAIFLYYSFILAKQSTNDTMVVKIFPLWKSTIYIIIGIAALVFGGKFMVDGASNIARNLGVSESIIGLTILAIGSSIPELATSAMAAYRKNSDIAIGNVVGSNIFNVFFILGVSSLIKPLPFSTNSNIDLLFAIAITILLFFFIYLYRENQLIRKHGIAFIVIYMAYISYLIFFEV
ncbi:MAG: calcium/sodium antiporter [Chitinophagales bacterium]|nr:calcium/sodium antiporter [Bacteroidota bacterium]MBP9188955.1 calcium/sodium antiporter [Chitinophagales bacterium]